jgi:type IV secretion system protein VirD4
MSTQNYNPNQKKKTSKITIVLLAGLALLVLYFAAAIGAALDVSQGRDGSVEFSLFTENIAHIVTDTNAVFAALGAGGYAPQIVFFAAVAMGIFALYKYSQIKKRLHRKGVEHGSAKFGDDKEMKELSDCGKDPKFPHKEPQFKPLLTSDGKRVFDDDGDFVGFIIDNNIILTEQVYMSLNSRQHLMNLNVLIIGGSGSGKTRFFAKPNIMQLNTSLVCTDPKGEILQAVGKMLIEAGYELRIFNTIEMAYSNNYNPFHYVYDYEGQLSEDSVTKMIDVFMQNTKGEGEKDDFWSQSAMKAITAIIFLLFEESEYNAVFDEDGKIVPATRDLSHLNFFSVTEKMRKLQYPPQGKEDGYFFVRGNESEEAFQTRRAEAHLCELDKDFIELERRKGETLATRLYKEIRNAPQETGQSIISTAGARTQMFNQKNLANLTCCDNIQLETLGDRKTALFIIISATNATYNFLAAMMYTQMFDVLANRANFKYGGVLPVHVRCIMDEFANIGQIPDFDKVIAFVRSMGMSLNVIIQNLAQLKARYEKTWEVITGNCDSLLFLGGKEASTLKEISESLGKETIDIESKNRTITGGHKNDSTAESNSILGRELMTPDEIQKMPISDCILMIRSHNPFYCNKFPIEKHPNFRFTEDFDKSNAFDKYSVRAITLEEFAEQNAQNKNDKNQTVDSPKNSSNKPHEMTQEKLETTVYPPDPPVEVTSESVPVDAEDFQTFAEVVQFGDDTSAVEVNEQIGVGKMHGTPSDYDSFAELSPERNYREMEVADDDEVSGEFSVDENTENADDAERFKNYAIPHNETESIEGLEGMSIECELAAQTETTARSIEIGAYDPDSAFDDSPM